MSRTMEEIISKLIRDTRNDTLDAAIEVCIILSNTNATAIECAIQIRRLKAASERYAPQPEGESNATQRS